ncbi:ap2 domain transcription factor ap2viia-4, partial [Cystoisospora suis]
ECGSVHQSGPRHWSCSVCPFADCVPSSGPPGFLPRCGPELHRLFFEHADCIRSSRCFVEQLAYAHIFRICLEPVNGGRPSALSPTHQQFLIRELSLLRQEPSRLLARNAFLWTGQPGCQNIINQCAPFSPPSFAPPGTVSSSSRASYLLSHESALSRVTGGPSWRAGVGALCEGSSGGTSDNRLLGHTGNAECHWGSEPGATCVSGAGRVSSRGQAALAAALAAGDDSGGSSEGKAATVTEVPTADGAAVADNSRGPLPTAKALLDPSIFLCTADMELGAQKTALVTSLRVLRSLAPSWAAQTEGGFAYHLQQILDVRSLQSKTLQNYRVVLQELFSEPPRLWRHDRLVDVLHDLDCLYSVAKRKQDILQRAQEARQQSAAAPVDTRAPRSAGKNEGPWGTVTSSSHTGPVDASGSQLASAGMEGDDEVRRHAMGAGTHGGQRVFSEEQPWLQRGESFHPNDDEQSFRRGLSAGQKALEDEEAETGPPSVRTSLRKRQLQEAEQPDTRKLARSSSSDLSQSMFASAASLISHRSVAGGIRRQRQGTREEEGESATDDEGQTVQTELGSSTPLADEDLQALQQQLDLLERHGLKPSNVGAVLAGIFKTGGKEAALRALQRLLLPASQQALAALRDGGFTEQEQQFMLQQLLSDNGGLDDIKVVPEKEIRSLGRGPGSAGYSHGDSGRQSRKPAGPSTAAAFSSATCEDKALEYERFASTRGGAESMMKRHREDSMTFGDRQDMGQCEQVSNGFSAPPLLSSDPCQMDPATYDQRKTNVFQLPSLQNNVNVHSQGSSLGSSSRFKFRHSGGASPASTTDSGGTRSRGGPSGVRGRSGGIPSTSGAGKSGMRSEGRSGGAGSSGHGRGGSGRDAASAASHIEEQAERLEYARRATQLEKVKGVFIGKKNTCWVAQWTDSTGRSRQTCYNIKTLGFEVARQKAIEERYRQMEASAYANGGSHKHQLTNGTAGNNALKSSASSDLSKEQCAQSTPPPSSTLVPGRWPMHRSQEGGTADGAAGESGSACKSSSLPEVASIQAGGSGRGVTGPEVASESGSTRSASSSPLSNSALVAAVVEATASVLNSTARPSHRSSSLSSSVLAADLLAQFKNASIPGAPQMPSSLLRSLSGTGAGATSVPDNRPEPPPCGGVVSGVSSSSALQPTVTSIPLSDRDDKIFPAGSRPTYPCLLSSGAAGGTEMLDQAAFQGASAPPLCGGTLRNYEDADSTTHLDPRAANESRASQSAGAVLAALLENSAETEGTSGASAGAHSTNNGDPFVNGASTGTCSEPSMKSPSLAYLSAALAQAFPSLSGSSSGAAGSPGGTDRGAGSAASTASPAPSQLLQQLVQHVLQSPRMQRSPQESPKQVDDRRSGLTSSSPSPASASKSETDVEHLMKTLGRHGVTPELLEALQQLGGTSKDLMSGPDSVPSTCPPSSGVQAKNGKGKSSSTFLTSPHTPARRPGSPLSVHEEADAAPKSSVHSSSASPQIASSVGRDSSDAMDQLALLFGGAGYCQDGSCIDAYSVDFGAAGSIMSRKHRMAYTHKQGRRTYASQARDFPRVEGIKYNVKCACWEVTSRTGFKVFSTRRLGGLQEAYNLAVKWKQEVDGGLYRGSDDEMPHSLTPDQQRALILLSQGNSLSPDTGEDDDVEDEDEDNATEKHPGSQESDSSKGETNDVEGTDATTASALTMQQPGQAEWQKGAGLPSWSQLEAGILSALQASTGSQRAGAWAGEPFEAPPGKGDSVSSNGVSEADLLGSLLEQLAKSTGESRSGRQEGAETGLISDCGGGETVQMLTDSGGESRTGVQDGERSNDAKAYHIANSFLEKKRKNMDCDGTLVPIRRMGSQSGSVEGMAKKIKALP